MIPLSFSNFTRLPPLKTLVLSQAIALYVQYRMSGNYVKPKVTVLMKQDILELKFIIIRLLIRPVVYNVDKSSTNEQLKVGQYLNKIPSASIFLPSHEFMMAINSLFTLKHI